MANSDKNILITPATNTSGDPRIVYTPNTAANVITQRLTDSGTISFEGSAGQLFSITNSLTGTLFSVNDVSGIPSIDVTDTGLVRISPYNGTLAIGSIAPIKVSSVDSEVSITASSAAQVPLAIRGASSQSANLTEWQSSAGTVLARIASTGQLLAPSIVGTAFQITSGGVFSNGSTSAPANTQAYFLTTSATNVGLVVRGAASQSANILEIQSSAGSILSRFSSTGQLVSDQQTYIGSGATSISNARFNVATGSSSVVGQVIRGASSQSANLQEWQDSFGNIHSGIAASGFGWFGGSSTAGGQLGITAEAATNRGIVIKGAASQSANLLEFQDNSANVLAAVNSAGLISSVRQISVTQSNAGETMMFVRGATSQTGDSFAVRDVSANTLAGFSATGRIYSGVSGSGQTYLGGLTLGGGSAVAQMGIVAGAATTIGAVIRGAASQTGNLQEWQDSSGNVLLAITSSGGIGSSGLTALRVDVNRNLALNSNSGSYGSGQAVTFIGNATAAPSSSPTGGGILYVATGALTYRGTSGSARTIVNADGTDPNPLDGTTSTAAAGVGYMGLPQNSTTSGSYTVAAADAGKHLYSANTRTVTINSNANLALPVGTTVTFISGPFATTTIAITSDTMYLAGAGTTGSRTLAAHGIATAVKTGTTTWIISGNGLT